MANALNESSVQFCSVAQSRLTLCDPMDCSMPGSLSTTNSWSLFRLMSIESVMPSNHLVLCHPLLLSPSIFPSISVFSNETVLRIMWPKYWTFSFSISPSNEYSGLISFRMDWLDLLAVQGTLKSLLQYHSSKASILQHSAFFIVVENRQIQNWEAFYKRSDQYFQKVKVMKDKERLRTKETQLTIRWDPGFIRQC